MSNVQESSKSDTDMLLSVEDDAAVNSHTSMAKEPSSTSNDAASPTADSYIGSFISVTSKCEIRYEGVLYYLNPQDSTLGLKDVRSYGTEGRKKNGQQVPPSDRVYEYILFRGSDIKGQHSVCAFLLCVSHFGVVLFQIGTYKLKLLHQFKKRSRALKFIKINVSYWWIYDRESNLYSEPSAMNARSYSSILPSHHSGTQLGIWSSSQSTNSAASSYGMPTQMQGFSGAPGSNAAAQQHSLTSSATLYPMQNQSTAIASTNVSNNVSPGHSLATSTSIYLNATPTLSSELSKPFTDSLPSKISLPFHHSTLINSNGLTMPFPLTSQNTSSIESQVVNKVVLDPVSLLPVQSPPYSTPSISDPTSDPLFKQQQTLLTPNHSQPKLSENPTKTLYPNQKVMGVMSSVPLNFSSSVTTPAVQPPLLPLPPPSQKLQFSSQFTEEFDFQAMNEKFKKDEVWGYLGKANQRDKVERIQENGTSSHDSGEDNPDLISDTEPKPAYKKDDFFDNISCNVVGRGARNGQIRSSERVKLDSETFGTFQRRTQIGYGAYRAGYGGHRGGRGDHRGPYNWGRGYNYSNRGRGGYNTRR
ncbi:Decapping 5-like protein [Sesamum angolense]|uniref:Decapping 5-like protein n=1 Tax=Sesamum angolense TaxID=2727404 RepID=A0AAE1T9W7_9LAMI|nr:Decapping 5-like protein [Sesamum angolense]